MTLLSSWALPSLYPLDLLECRLEALHTAHQAKVLARQILVHSCGCGLATEQQRDERLVEEVAVPFCASWRDLAHAVHASDGQRCRQQLLCGLDLLAVRVPSRYFRTAHEKMSAAVGSAVPG